MNGLGGEAAPCGVAVSFGPVILYSQFIEGLSEKPAAGRHVVNDKDMQFVSQAHLKPPLMSVRCASTPCVARPDDAFWIEASAGRQKAPRSCWLKHAAMCSGRSSEWPT